MGETCTSATFPPFPKIFNSRTAQVEIANYEVFIPRFLTVEPHK